MSTIESSLSELMDHSREISWRNFGKTIQFYHPGMFRYHGSWGNYPALSITGEFCELQCDHCKGIILRSMIPVKDSGQLVSMCVELEKKGCIGCLLSGGSRGDGTLPWSEFLHGIETVKEKTSLRISIHTGLLDAETALELKAAGVDQALIDVIGDSDTFRDIYHVPFGIEKIHESLSALHKAGIPIFPHIIVGLNYGEIKGEYEALDMVRRYDPAAVTVISLMALRGTPMEKSSLPLAEDIARFIAVSRIKLPRLPLSLGCARDKTNHRIDVLAVDCGVNRIALPSEEAVQRAKDYDLHIDWRKTCCSVE